MRFVGRTKRVVRRAASTSLLLLRALAADIHARSKRGPGLEFSSFGRRLGIRLLRHDRSAALSLLLVPVNIVRYWEFPFVARHLEKPVGDCLDVASPRLFSYFVAARMRPASIRIINPDSRDARLTENHAARFGLTSIEVDPLPVSAIAGRLARYDHIWSISVLEHIPGEGDHEAIQTLWQALRGGGRLLITVPVDRTAWDEFRDHDVYQTGVPREARGYFFQRWYDEAAIHRRLLGGIDSASVDIEWFGERVPGHFASYERAWIERGYRTTVEDPREIVDHYSRYRNWVDMPGRGVAGIAITKAAA